MRQGKAAHPTLDDGIGPFLCRRLVPGVQEWAEICGSTASSNLSCIVEWETNRSSRIKRSDYRVCAQSDLEARKRFDSMEITR